MSNFDLAMLTKTEQSVFRLRSLYGAYGYAPYKMSKFEEYDLYVRNKSFLLSDHIITFTDHGGKLMALKPDVTLSIVKHAEGVPGRVQKVYYNENVYRVPKGDESFKEIMQVGIECVGDVNAYNVSEVVTLAVRSLSEFSEDYVLDVSHLGVVSAFLDALGAEGKQRDRILTCIGERNLHGVREACAEGHAPAELTDVFCRLLAIYGDSETVLPRLWDIVGEADGCGSKELAQLDEVILSVRATNPTARIHVDFSVINNLKYYNGIVFRGFVRGVAADVLSGGQYDLLLRRMGKEAGAVGFAVYLDRLEALDDARPAYDLDTVILYDGATVPAGVIATAVHTRIAKGERVLAVTALPTGVTYRQLVRVDEKGGEVVESNV